MTHDLKLTRTPAQRAFACLLILLSLGVTSVGRATALPPGVPTLDEMAGKWIPASVASNLPDVHNFNDMLIVNRDLSSFFCWPGGLFTKQDLRTTQWRVGYPLVKMTLDGLEYSATDFRWFPYRVLRRNENCAGLIVENDTRMVNEQRGVLCQITITNPSQNPRQVKIGLHVPGDLQGEGSGVINRTLTPRTTSVVQCSRVPDQTTIEGGVVTWHWECSIPPGGHVTVGYAAGDGNNDFAAETGRKVANWAAHLPEEMAEFETVWRERWADAFTPGNPHFSGSLPVLHTDAAALRRNYYMGALTMLILERTQFPISRAFVTSGERGEGVQYFWDAAMQSTAWALLEPKGMKAVLRRWLAQNPRGGPHMNLRDVDGYDRTHYDVIHGYATNACTIFSTTDVYLRVTGDQAFLEEKLETGRSVLEALDALATDWETLPKTQLGLANYGGNGKLLETASAYIEGVASVNAQNVFLMRQVAKWQALKGEQARATELRTKADALIPTVMRLFNSETGAWNADRMTGPTVAVQHCVDFIYAGDALQNDLTVEQKKKMLGFVQRELLTDYWMRAMSWKDPAAPRSLRPDHSPTGSYDGWIPLTVATMWRLGATEDAYDFYCRTAAVTEEGAFSQAHEFYGPSPASRDAAVRIAMHGSNMKECISGGAFADVALTTFFGFAPSADGKEIVVGRETPRPFSGRLEYVRYGKTFYTISADGKGLLLSAAQPSH